MIRELKQELERLRAALAGGGILMGEGGAANDEQLEQIKREIEEKNRKEMEEMRKKMEELEKEKENMKNWDSVVNQANNRASDMNVLIEPVDMKKKETHPYITNLNEDEGMNKQLYYFFEEGETTIGTKAADPIPNICLAGMGIAKQHAIVNRAGDKCSIQAVGKSVINVNGTVVKERVEINNYDRIIFGHNHVFVFVIPTIPPPENLDDIDYEYAANELNAVKMQVKFRQQQQPSNQLLKMRSS